MRASGPPVTKACIECGRPFTVRASHAPKRQRCSKACMAATLRRKIGSAVHNYLGGAPRRFCQFCKREYRSFDKRRIYCSYDCFVQSGGPQRAGEASVRATMRYGAKKDANHAEVMGALREHCAAYDLSSAGCGLPDGIAWVPPGIWCFFDIKNPKTTYGRKGLNKVQKRWLARWEGGPVYLLYSAEEAARFAKGEFQGIKFEKSGWMERNEK